MKKKAIYPRQCRSLSRRRRLWPLIVLTAASLFILLLPAVAMSQTTIISGALEVTDSTFNRPREEPPCALGGGPVYFDTYTYSHPGGPIIIGLYGETLSDPFLVLYNAPFDPDNPCANFVAADNDSGGGTDSRLSLDLPVGTYIIVATSFENGMTGAYELEIRRPPSILGALEGTDPTFNRPVAYEDEQPCTLSGRSVYFDTYTYSHSGGPLTIDLMGETLSDPFLVLYNAPFDPDNPCANFVAADDDSGGGPSGLDSRLSLCLPAGTYIIVATSYENGNTGAYGLTIQGPPPPLIVNTTVDELDGSCGDGDCSLRDAIVLAGPCDIIIIPSGTYTLSLGHLEIANKDLTLMGARADTTIIQAATDPNRATWRVFMIYSELEPRTVNISGLTIRHGNVPYDPWLGGGGILHWGGILNLTDCTVAFNSANAGGGGILNVFGAMTITNSTVHGNRCENAYLIWEPDGGGFGGGGILDAYGETTIINSTISGNISSRLYPFSPAHGGGISSTSGEDTLYIHNTTITGNLAFGDGGGVWANWDPPSPVSISGSIVAGNHALGIGPDCSGHFDSWGYNLIGDGTDATGFEEYWGDRVGSAGSPIDPMLGPLAYNGGPTPTHALLPGSPAIDWVEECERDTDQRGVARPQDGDGDGEAICDIGAFEARRVTLQVAIAGSGVGTVNINPPDMDCTAICTQMYLEGEQVGLAAMPEAGSSFAGWSGHCSGTNPLATVLMNSNKGCTATFTAIPGEIVQVLPVYRFLSDALDHFYTISEAERELVNNVWSDFYTEEGIGFYAYPTQFPGTEPVHRFLSPSIWSHFYTISNEEMNYILTTWPGYWMYEGVAFYAYATQQPGTLPVYRFWSPVYGTHFYTISEEERIYVMATWPDVWTYEGVAFYAYP